MGQPAPGGHPAAGHDHLPSQALRPPHELCRLDIGRASDGAGVDDLAVGRLAELDLLVAGRGENFDEALRIRLVGATAQRMD